MYNFDIGYVFYNNDEHIYKPATPWAISGKHAKISLQIHDVNVTQKKYYAEYNIDVLIIRTKILYGTVSFDVYIYKMESLKNLDDITQKLMNLLSCYVMVIAKA